MNIESFAGYANMIVSSSISTCSTTIVRLSGRMGDYLRGGGSHGASSSCCYCFNPGHSKIKFTGLSVSKTFSCSSAIASFHRSCFRSTFSKQRGSLRSLMVKGLVSVIGHGRGGHLEISLASQSMNTRLLVPKQGMHPKKCLSLSQGCASAGLFLSLLVCYSSSKPVHAEEAKEKGDNADDNESSYVKFSHGKKVYTDYSIIGIPGDGRCLFRSVAHGACLRSGKPAPSELLQRELADDLRAQVADEFIKRREETEWFVEGDFDKYVVQMRKSHVWGGEPELFMASHVLHMPITVYMYDKDAGGLISIAEYGQEYGRENPIRVLYHGFGHYDALHIPGKKGCASKL